MTAVTLCPALIIGLALGVGTTTPAGAPPRLAAAVGNQFLPPTIEVRAGEAVTFLNADPMSGVVGHSLTHHDPLPLFDSGLLRPGTAGEVRGIPSLPPGRYGYFCVVHPPMEGILVVTN